MKNFARVCRMSQSTLKTYVRKILERKYEDVIVGDGFVYAQGEFPVLLVAHLDTVHKSLPSNIFYDAATDTLSCDEGIGGDDRCGVYMILEVIKKYKCSVLFCEDEEVGGVGAKKFTKSDVSNGLSWNYMIEFDRMGSKDAVFYDCDNKEFTKFITEEFYEEDYGSFSDISTLAPHFKCAAVNLSCGYYKAHTVNEYVVFHEMRDSIEAACKILDRTTKEDAFEYIKAVYNYSYSRLGGYYSNTYDDDLYWYIEFINEDGDSDWYETYASNKYEAVGSFCIDNPHVPFASIVDVLCDSAMSSYRMY